MACAPSCIAGGPYIALSHQHTIAALQEIKKTFIKEKLDLPNYLKVVRASVLKHRTPLHVRMLVSGGDQNKQGNVAGVKISRVMTIFLSLYKESTHVSKKQEMLLTAIKMSGFRRPTTQKQIEEWNGLVNYCIDN